jgi:hypothetical protein
MGTTALVNLGHQALAAVAGCVASGEPLVRCQLLASEFYEAVKRELRRTPSTDPVKRDELIAAAVQCHRAARASINPQTMLTEFRSAVAILQSDQTPMASQEQGMRPRFRVIEGRLSKR